MAVSPDDVDPVLDRAAHSLRATASEARWIDISDAIASRVRATSRRTLAINAGFITPATVSGRLADTLRVSDLVVRTFIRRALAGVHGAEPTAVDLYLDGHTCVGAHVEVVGVYGHDLRTVGDELADITVSVLDDVLGAPPVLTREDVDVRVHDIREAD